MVVSFHKRSKQTHFLKTINMPVIRLQRLIIKSSFSVSTLINLGKKRVKK